MNNNIKILTMEQVDEINTIHACLQSVTELMVSCDDLDVVNRDKLAMLLGYFTRQLQEIVDDPTTLNENYEEIIVNQKCLSVVADLMSPCDDLHLVNRDDFELLFTLFFNRLMQLIEGAA